MGRLITSLKKLGKKLTGNEIKSNTLLDVVAEIADNYGRIEVNNITALTNDQCEMLDCGDVVIKNESGNKHAYIVSYKEHHVGICLTYTDAENVETVSYDYTDGNWVYNSTDITHIAAE